MKYRKLRIAWSVVWGVVAVLLIALWVRSYWIVDYVSIFKSYSVASMRGFLFFDAGIWHKANGAPPFHHFGFIATMGVWNWNGVGVAGIECRRFIQIWLLVPVVVAIAGLPWIRKRFGLRALLIGMTLLACLLGFGAWSARNYRRELESPMKFDQP